MKYVKTFIQKMVDGAPVKETVRDFGIYTKDIPFVIYGEAKDLYANDWKGEDGSDEYIPSVIPLKEYDMDVEFAYKGALGSAGVSIRRFLDYLTGRDGTTATLKIYNTYTKIGRQKVRYVKTADDATIAKENSEEVVIFKVTFRVNDPITDIIIGE